MDTMATSSDHLHLAQVGDESEKGQHTLLILVREISKKLVKNERDCGGGVLDTH
jgi:hypothetical protein